MRIQEFRSELPCTLRCLSQIGFIFWGARQFTKNSGRLGEWLGASNRRSGCQRQQASYALRSELFFVLFRLLLRRNFPHQIEHAYQRVPCDSSGDSHTALRLLNTWISRGRESTGGVTHFCELRRLGNRPQTSGFFPTDPTGPALDTCPRGNHSGSTAPYGVRCVLRAHHTGQSHLRASRPAGTGEGLPAGGHRTNVCLGYFSGRNGRCHGSLRALHHSVVVGQAEQDLQQTARRANCKTSRISCGPFRTAPKQRRFG